MRQKWLIVTWISTKCSTVASEIPFYNYHTGAKYLKKIGIYSLLNDSLVDDLTTTCYSTVSNKQGVQIIGGMGKNLENLIGGESK